MARGCEAQLDYLAVVDTDQDRCLLVDHSELGQKCPLDVEEPTVHAELHASARVDRAGAGDHEVQPAEIANKVQFHLLCEQLGTVERCREPGLGGRNTARRDEVEAHGHGDRLQERATRPDEGPPHLLQAVVRRDKNGSGAPIKGQLLQSRGQLFAAVEVGNELGQVVDETGVGTGDRPKPLPDGLANRRPSCFGFLAYVVPHDCPFDAVMRSDQLTPRAFPTGEVVSLL